ncbi:ATP-binding protein [Actinoplanes bogorensis]|uniref:ATP-binding protein n=1 Tax=Paractinoplanes bogorensis TaxID=1610840 RepID=A0ABS5YLF7_9ACTN|nr:AAA family ATPase [Actinoplanes bogorensis]MBU2664304.1 ATP-binding protein [Actinoplanes bogorensis]
MPRLILLNGPAACGKSTLARMYVERHPLALALDVDRVRDLIGGWRDHRGPAGLLARAIALAAAREHLAAGHDVVVPQLLARPQFIEQLETLDAEFHEIVLVDDLENVLRRDAVRGDGNDPGEITELYHRLMALLPARPRARLIRLRDGDVEGAYQDVLDALT